MTRPARILWTATVPEPHRRVSPPPRRRKRRRAVLTLLLGLAVALLLAMLGRCDRAGARALLDGQSATLLPDGSWLVVGGDGSAGPTADGWLEDPATGSRIGLPAVLLHARAGHTATLLADGRVLIWGGRGADGRLVDQAEILDPAARASAEWTGRSPAPRAHHTATLLPDSAVLVAGGVGPDGALVASLETWDLRGDTVERWRSALPSPRLGHTAAIDGDGGVWLSDGADQAGHTVAAVVRLDPAALTVSVEAPPAAPAGLPAVARTWPPPGERGVSPDAALALTVLPPLAPATVTADTVTLAGPSGFVPIRPIAAEGGRLVLVTPLEALMPGAGYTLALDGARDAAGRALPPFALSFTTAGLDGDGPPSARAGSAPASPSTPVPWASSAVIGDPLAGPPPADPATGEEPWEWRGPRQAGRPWSPWQDLPPHRAAAGVTALSGQVLDLAGQPLAGVTLELGTARARTDLTGRFLLARPGPDPAGPSAHRGELVVDGDTVARPGRVYGRFEIGVALAPGQTTVLPYTIWLPALDMAHARTLPEGPLPDDLVLTSPRLPGLEVHLPAGSRLRDHAGRPVTRVSLTPIPPDRPPFPLPAGVETPAYFTLQPGGAYVAHPNHTGARIIYPNFTDARRASPGTRCAFWHYEPDEAAWRVYGEGSVAPGGEQIVPDPGVAVYEFTGAMLNVNFMAPPLLGAAPGSQAWAGDPVDLATGLFVFTTTDLFLPGVPALSLTRTYRPEDPAIRPFGRGASHAYALFLWSAEQYQEADLVLPDGGRVHYVRTSPGVGFGDAVFAHTGSPTVFSGSTIRWVQVGGGWDLRLRDGTLLRFGINAPLQWIRDRAGNTVTLHRAGGEPLGPIVRVAASNGRWLALDYDAASRVSQVRDSAGRSVRYTYDDDHRLVAVTDPLGGITRYTYDAAHRMLSITDARGVVFLRNGYDSAGRVTSQTLADGAVHTFAYALDAGGRVTESRVTDPAGSIRRVAFDAGGYSTSETAAWGTALARTTTFDRDPTSHRIRSMVDPLGRRTAFQYDSTGNLTRLILLEGTPTPATWVIAYEPQFSRPVSVTDPLGRAATLAYDPAGSLVALTDPTGRRVTLTYDAEGQPLTIATAAGTTHYAWAHGDLIAVTDPLGRQWTRAVDGAGRPTTLVDPLGRTTRLTWDALNRLVERLDPAGGRTTFTHDATGNLLAATNARGHTTAYAYDAMDRRVSRTDQLGRVSRYEYDAAGRSSAVIDRLGQATRIAWDALHRPASVTDAEGTVTTYSWDAADRLIRIDDTRSAPITRQYDLLDRLVEEATGAGAVQYAYDPAGQRVRLTPAGQPATEYTYDAGGRLTAVNGDGGTLTLALDAAGRPTLITRPTGLLTEITWDAASHVTRLAWRQGSSVLGDLTQGYDAAGQPVMRGGSSAATRLPAAFTGAVYDEADRLLAAGPRTLSWDAEGRMIELDDAVAGRTRYTWNARGQLVRVDGPSAQLAFDYDGLDRRVEAVDGSVVTEWLHDGLTPLVERRQGAGHATRLVGPELDRLWARTGPAGRRWPLDDMLGSPIAWTDDAGRVVTRATYGPFGESSVTGETQPIGFTGREQDRPDLLHFRARPYVPSLQRFISEDPVDEPGGHRYTYAGNAPLSGVDPLGLYTIIIHGGPASSREPIVGNQGSNIGLNMLANFLDSVGEPLGVYTAGQLDQAMSAAQDRCRRGQPVHLVGHSMGGTVVIDIAWTLALRGILVSDLTAIDAFNPRMTMAPPGITALSFYQTQHPPAGAPLGGRKVNSWQNQLVSGLVGYTHLTITSEPRVQTQVRSMILGHQVPCTTLW